MDPDKIKRTYTNGSITVVWKPGACIHSTICWKEATGLPTVFNPREKPWIKMDGNSSESIMAQVNKCPSGALSFYFNDATENETAPATETRMEVMRNGPLLVHGNILLRDQAGIESKLNAVTAFCRCGLSGNKPFCDGSHHQVKLDEGPA